MRCKAFSVRSGLLLAAVLFFAFPAQSQETPQQRIHLFLKALADKGTPLDKVIGGYICTTTSDMVGYEKQQHEFVVNTLGFLRKKLQLQHLNKITITKYKDLPDAQQNVTIEEPLTNDLYRVLLSDKESINVLLDGDRIVSCVTMHKGSSDEGFLLTFCTHSKQAKPKKAVIDSAGR